MNDQGQTRLSASGLDAYERRHAGLRGRNRSKNFGNKELDVGEPIRVRTQHNDGDLEGGKILLEGEISIYGDKYVELFRGERQ